MKDYSPSYGTEITLGTETKSWVWCMKCLEWVDAAEKVSFLNIEEDIQGMDNMTFICDKCGQESRSKVIAKETQPRSR